LEAPLTNKLFGFPTRYIPVRTSAFRASLGLIVFIMRRLNVAASVAFEETVRVRNGKASEY
jgi:hypothetical protein